MVRPIYVVLVIKTTRHQGKQLFYCIMISSLQVLLVFIFLLSFMFNVKLPDNFCKMLGDSQMIPGMVDFLQGVFLQSVGWVTKTHLPQNYPKYMLIFRSTSAFRNFTAPCGKQ